MRQYSLCGDIQGDAIDTPSRSRRSRSAAAVRSACTTTSKSAACSRIKVPRNYFRLGPRGAEQPAHRGRYRHHADLRDGPGARLRRGTSGRCTIARARRPCGVLRMSCGRWDGTRVVRTLQRSSACSTLRALLAAQSAGTHVYCCGPAGLMSAVKAARRQDGFPRRPFRVVRRAGHRSQHGTRRSKWSCDARGSC